MKVKLLKVITGSRTLFRDYDDVTDVTRHIVTENSDWEEVSDDYLDILMQFVQDENRKPTTNGYYILVEETQPLSARMAIDVMVERRTKEREKMQKKAAAREKEKLELKVKRAEKRRASLERQLAALNVERDKKS